MRLWKTEARCASRRGQPQPLKRLNPQPSTLNRLLWLLLPACASVLLLATTNKLCQDVAVIPFLWVLPLALYLLSFIICFDSPRWYAPFPCSLALLAALGGLGWALLQGNILAVMANGSRLLRRRCSSAAWSVTANFTGSGPPRAGSPGST